MKKLKMKKKTNPKVQKHATRNMKRALIEMFSAKNLEQNKFAYLKIYSLNLYHGTWGLEKK